VSGHDDVTIATWINLSSVDTWSRVFDFGSGTGVNMFLTPEAGFDGGPMRFAIKPGGQAEQLIDGPSLSAGQWRHVAVTIDGDIGSLYLDGVLVGTNTSMTFDPADLGITTQNYLGDSQYESDPSLFGRIDDFRIYNEALPAEQIAQLAGAAATSFAMTAEAPATTSLIAISEALDNPTSENIPLFLSTPQSVAATTSDPASAIFFKAEAFLSLASSADRTRDLLLSSLPEVGSSDMQEVESLHESFGLSEASEDYESVDQAFALLGVDQSLGSDPVAKW
jgi:hypothetical protein